MRMFRAAVVGLSVALPLGALGALPAHAQNAYSQGSNGVLGQVQRFFNGNQNGETSHQRAYEQGRRDQARASHERWRERHAENDHARRYGDEYHHRHDNGYNRAYNGHYDNGRHYSGG